MMHELAKLIWRRQLRILEVGGEWLHRKSKEEQFGDFVGRGVEELLAVLDGDDRLSGSWQSSEKMDRQRLIAEIKMKRGKEACGRTG